MHLQMIVDASWILQLTLATPQLEMSKLQTSCYLTLSQSFVRTARAESVQLEKDHLTSQAVTSDTVHDDFCFDARRSTAFRLYRDVVLFHSIPSLLTPTSEIQGPCRTCESGCANKVPQCGRCSYYDDLVSLDTACRDFVLRCHLRSLFRI